MAGTLRGGRTEPHRTTRYPPSTHRSPSSAGPRGDVGRSATLCVEEPIVAELLRQGREAEVGDLEVPVLVEQQVLWLQVAVRDPAAVAEVDGGDELLEFDDVRVADEPHDGDLALDLFHHAFLLDVVLADDLNSDALSGLEVLAVVDLGERSFPGTSPSRTSGKSASCRSAPLPFGSKKEKGTGCDVGNQISQSPEQEDPASALSFPPPSSSWVLSTVTGQDWRGGCVWEEGLTEAAVSSGIHERREEIVICRDPIVEREAKGRKEKGLYGGGL
ncbi:hypothetical protein NL676_035148 [Syzygium grande]|nr:hypothetical protein NL676_035148 [Syzygium grande]